MREVWLRICLTQLLNTITVFLFYLSDNPVRNLILAEGYPIIFCTIFAYICAPLTLTYLICYWLLSGVFCMYSCVQNCCVILRDWFVGVRSCTVSWKMCYRGTEEEDYALRGGERGGGGVADETVSVISAPPSYHSSLPPYIPRQVRDPARSRRLRHQEASLTALRGALSDVRQPGSEPWELRRGLRQGMGQPGQEGVRAGGPPPPPPAYIPPPPPHYTDPPPQYSVSHVTPALPLYRDIDTGTVSGTNVTAPLINADTPPASALQLGQDIP